MSQLGYASGIANVRGYSAGDYPQDAVMLMPPTPCACKPALNLAWARALATKSKVGYEDFTATGSDAPRRHLRKTILQASSIDLSATGVWGTEGGSTIYYHYSGSATHDLELVYEINPRTGAETLVSVEGFADINLTNYLSADPPRAGYPTTAAPVSGYNHTGTAERIGATNSWAWDPLSPFNTVWGWNAGLTPASITTTPTEETRQWNIGVGYGIPETPGTMTQTTTLSVAYATEDLVAHAEELLAAAEALATDVPWHARASYFNDHPRYLLQAAFGTISEGVADAAVAAAEDALDAAEAALAAINPLHTLEVHNAETAVALAEIALAVAEQNQTMVGVTVAPILITLDTDYASRAQAYRITAEDDLSMSLSSLRLRLMASVAPLWDYATAPVDHRFAWRLAAWAAGDALPDFTPGEAVVSTVSQFLNASAQKSAFVVSPVQTLACPAVDGYLEIASPEAPHTTTREVQHRSGAMRKLGFAAYGLPSDPPAIYRLETFTGALSGEHGYELVPVEYWEEEGDPPENWQYVSEGLPEEFPQSLLSPCPHIQTVHLCAFRVPGETSTVRTWGSGSTLQTATLSNPWLTSEITDAVTAHVEADWPGPENDYAEPPHLPDTETIFYLPMKAGATLVAIQCSAFRLLPSDETYFALGRNRYRCQFALPDSVQFAPDYEAGREVEWTWKKLTRDLLTGEVVEEPITASIEYGASESSNPSPGWTEMPAPEENATLVWLSEPETTDPWSWGSPTCRAVCPS